jgi:uncharacterized protein (DUF1015 family)
MVTTNRVSIDIMRCVIEGYINHGAFKCVSVDPFTNGCVIQRIRWKFSMTLYRYL